MRSKAGVRGMYAAVIGATCLAAALGVATCVALAVPLGTAIAIGSIVSSSTAVLVLVTARRLSVLLRARAHKPSVQLFSKELGTLSSADEIVRTVERTLGRWLLCEYVQLELEDRGRPFQALDRPESGFQRSAPKGNRSETPSDEQVSFPVRFQGALLAVLHLSGTPESIRLSSEDLDLLETIGNLTAIALAHANACQELDQKSKQQAAAWRGEREALVETVAAEIAHEVRYPINFFRNVFERTKQGALLDDEDVDIGRQEVERLEELVAGLRRVAVHRLERRIVRVSELCARAEALLGDAFDVDSIQIDIDQNAALNCDVHQTTHILVNLLTNALEAISDTEKLGVSFHYTASGADLCVWDNGPGFTADPRRLFVPWYTTKPRGTGLGLAITHRLVRAHGWSIAAARSADRTVFTISIRAEDLLRDGSSFERASKAEVA